MIGDVVHNARTALDHLAYRLVQVAGGTPDENTCFPITNAATGWGDRARRTLKGVTHETRQVVKALEPWKGGSDALWRLHHLDLVDKHRVPLVVLAHYRGIIIGGEEWAPFPSKPDIRVTLPKLALRAAQVGPIHDGYVGYTEPFDTQHDGAFPYKLPEVHLELAFGPDTEASGEQLGTVLDQVVDQAEAAVAQVRSACGL